MILMVIAAGGAFKEVLTVSGVALEIAGMISGNAFPPLIAGWLVAAGIRVMIGSATIAGLTTAGIYCPTCTVEWRYARIDGFSLLAPVHCFVPMLMIQVSGCLRSILVFR